MARRGQLRRTRSMTRADIEAADAAMADAAAAADAPAAAPAEVATAAATDRPRSAADDEAARQNEMIAELQETAAIAASAADDEAARQNEMIAELQETAAIARGEVEVAIRVSEDYKDELGRAQRQLRATMGELEAMGQEFRETQDNLVAERTVQAEAMEEELGRARGELRATMGELEAMQQELRETQAAVLVLIALLFAIYLS